MAHAVLRPLPPSSRPPPSSSSSSSSSSYVAWSYLGRRGVVVSTRCRQPSQLMVLLMAVCNPNVKLTQLPLFLSMYGENVQQAFSKLSDGWKSPWNGRGHLRSQQPHRTRNRYSKVYSSSVSWSMLYVCMYV